MTFNYMFAKHSSHTGIECVYCIICIVKIEDPCLEIYIFINVVLTFCYKVVEVFWGKIYRKKKCLKAI